MDIKRVVIKIGTSTITNKKGLCNIAKMRAIVDIIAELKSKKIDVVVVTSGAVGIGAGRLGLLEMPKQTSLRQACASLGQCVLMDLYAQLFSKHGYMVSQILLTQDVLDSAENEFNTKNTFKELLKRNVVPIVNANDTVYTKEIEFGDNDSLSAAVSFLIDAHILIILTDIDGVYDKNPKKNIDAKLINKICNVDENLKKAVSGGANVLGTGGMVTKLKAASKVASKLPTVILNGEFPDRILKALKGEVCGTLIDFEKKFEMFFNVM